LVNEPTYIHDLVLTNNPDNIVDLTAHSKLPLSILSNHFVITFKIYSKFIYLSIKVVTKLRNFSRGDFEGLCHHLSISDFTSCYQTNDIEFVGTLSVLLLYKNAMH